VEDGGPGLVYLDLTGLGDEPTIVRRLGDAAAAFGLHARVGIAGSRAAALLAARRAEGITVIPPGAEAPALADAPIALLDGAPETARLLSRWGITTVGGLAALPASGLFERMGTEGLRLYHLARGEDRRPLAPYVPPLVLEESIDLDWEVEGLEALGEVARRLADRLSTRLENERLMTDRIVWVCDLADRSHHEGEILPAAPAREPAALVSLLRSALESRPPAAAVTAMRIIAHPVRVPAAQASLTDPPRPGARALAETLAHLTALVGVSQVGVPALLDSHRPDAMRIDAFALASPRPASPPSSSSPGGEGRGREAVLTLRRLRPPRPAAVRLLAGRPVHLRSHRLAGTIVASAGPWRGSGEWWFEGGWRRDEWDVELADGTLCRLAHDGSAWSLDAVYD
jgi:protein ImuB